MPWTTRSVVSVPGVFLCAIDAHAQSHKVTVVGNVDYAAGVEYPDGKDRLDLDIPDGQERPVPGQKEKP
jgi:hypothetical protein